jgi:hypothetical protein
MRKLLSRIKLYSSYFRLSSSNKNDYADWWRRGFMSPAPHFVKMNVLTQYKFIELWIETGTFMGDTSEALAKRYPKVITIEPDPKLYARAAMRFLNVNNLEVINGLSELTLEGILHKAEFERIDSVGLWLDGHFSEGITFKGPLQTPIIKELEIIEKFNGKFKNVYIFIDDFRSFVNGEIEYPKPNYLVDWAVRGNFSWEVHHDIFVMRSH